MSSYDEDINSPADPLSISRKDIRYSPHLKGMDRVVRENGETIITTCDNETFITAARQFGRALIGQPEIYTSGEGYYALERVNKYIGVCQRVAKAITYRLPVDGTKEEIAMERGRRAKRFNIALRVIRDDLITSIKGMGDF